MVELENFIPLQTRLQLEKIAAGVKTVQDAVENLYELQNSVDTAEVIAELRNAIWEGSQFVPMARNDQELQAAREVSTPVICMSPDGETFSIIVGNLCCQGIGNTPRPDLSTVEVVELTPAEKTTSISSVVSHVTAAAKKAFHRLGTSSTTHRLADLVSRATGITIQTVNGKPTFVRTSTS